MALLWAGAEDVDFPNGVTPSEPLGNYRSGYARCSLLAQSGLCWSNIFQGGAVTSAWLTARIENNATSTSVRIVGVALNGSSGLKGLWFGMSTTSNSKYALYKYDGTTLTQLAAESGNSFTSSLNRLDMQISSYGTSATVNVYINGNLLITFTGDVTVSGMTNFDCVALPSGSGFDISEIMVTSDDSRYYQGLSLLTPNALGTTSQWSNNAASNINQTSFGTDSSPTYDNNNGDQQQYTLTSMPTGAFTIAGTKISARAAVGAGSAVAHLTLGYKEGSTTAYGGSAVAPGPTYTTYEQLDTINPTTSVAWVQSDFTSLQLSLKATT